MTGEINLTTSRFHGRLKPRKMKIVALNNEYPQTMAGLLNENKKTPKNVKLTLSSAWLF